MIVLWIAAAVFSALVSALIVFRAAKAATAAQQPGEDPALAVYRRQLSEIDDLAERGLIPAEEHRSAHTEAARRLLSAAEQTAPPTEAAPTSDAAANTARWAVLAAAVAVPLIAAALYLQIGSPGLPDQPFAARLAQWRHADLSTLTPPQLAALLATAVDKYPNDPMPLYYLARAQAESGDLASAEHSLRKAIALAPNRPELWSMLGTVLSSGPTGENSPDTLKAFQQAHALDPSDPDASYFLARAKVASGDVEGGLADWRTLSAALKPGDPRKPVLDQEIAVVEKTRALPQAAGAQAPGEQAAGQGNQQAFIKAMVDRLAARLQSQPDDPPGWARLIRAYAVLGDQPDEAAAMTRAQALFKDRPIDLKLVQSAASAPQGAVQ